jgi:hypothetical protein
MRGAALYNQRYIDYDQDSKLIFYYGKAYPAFEFDTTVFY